MCLGITEDELGAYTVFEVEENLSSCAAEVPAERLREQLMQKIIIEIKKDLYRNFSEFDPNPWESGKIQLPVKIAYFIKKSEVCTVRAVALVKSEDISGLNVLKYLPYEYKKYYLEKVKVKLDRNFR